MRWRTETRVKFQPWLGVYDDDDDDSHELVSLTGLKPATPERFRYPSETRARAFPAAFPAALVEAAAAGKTHFVRQ